MSGEYSRAYASGWSSSQNYKISLVANTCSVDFGFIAMKHNTTKWISVMGSENVDCSDVFFCQLLER